MLRRQEKRCGGFTLVEMLVCIAIVALLATALVPAISESSARSRLSNAADRVALALRTTRDLALGEARPEIFAFDREKHVVQSGDGRVQSLASDFDVRLVARGADARGGTIRFFADGGSTGGVLRLSLQKRQLDVAVDWLTGRVSIAKP
jgi:general secretion pathway protein H